MTATATQDTAATEPEPPLRDVDALVDILHLHTLQLTELTAAIGSEPLQLLPRTHLALILRNAIGATMRLSDGATKTPAADLWPWVAALVSCASAAVAAALRLALELRADADGVREKLGEALAASPAGDSIAAAVGRLVDESGQPAVARLVDVPGLEVTALIMPASAPPWVHPPRPAPTTPIAPPFATPTCTECGCTEQDACARVGDDGTAVETCAWHDLNPETNAGVCTACART